jgi:hypothetical protein
MLICKGLCNIPQGKGFSTFYIRRGRSWDIHAGALNFPNESEPGRVIVTSSDATLHENYNGFTINNDIAVIRLSESVSGPSKTNPNSSADLVQILIFS